MEYTKAPLTFGQQAQMLIERGLRADPVRLVEKLKSVNYYRLSGYWFPFQNPDNTFKPNTDLDTIWKRYTFDRQLRLLVLDAIERVEVSVRTNIAYEHAHRYGAFGYADRSTLPNLTGEDFSNFQERLQLAISAKRKIDFVKHFMSKYGDNHKTLPVWILIEIISFGNMVTFYRGLDRKTRKQISDNYGIRFGVLESWLQSLNVTRNICAHHGRLWNSQLGYKPLIPQKDNQWHSPVEVNNNKIFAILTILKYIMDIIAPQSSWNVRLLELINDYPEIPIEQIGIPQDWRDCPIWR